MKPTIVRSLGIVVLVLGAVGGLAGCQVQQVRPAHHHGPVYADPWYDHDYFYYPGVQVYFHIHTGTYWYRDRGYWHRAHRLPPHIVILPRERVRIRVDRGEPWRHHQEHQQRYRPRFAPRDYQRPEYREHDRREREHNQQLYRDHRDRREPRVNQAPPRRQEYQLRQAPRDRQERVVRREQRVLQPAPLQREREARPARQVRQERELRREQHTGRDDAGHQPRQVRREREREVRHDRGARPADQPVARQASDEPQERQVREGFHDRRGGLTSREDDDKAQRRGTVDRRQRYSERR